MFLNIRICLELGILDLELPCGAGVSRLTPRVIEGLDKWLSKTKFGLSAEQMKNPSLMRDFSILTQDLAQDFHRHRILCFINFFLLCYTHPYYY
jgi:hypothetical protein